MNNIFRPLRSTT